ncbi:MAG TPA: hypothetical protein VH207_06380 [Chthoniobacterales bacterium]|nr:hypothetical protein [Chthoniobacterales bacterium]
MPKRKKIIVFTVLLALAWSGAIAFGLRTLLAYEATPGAVGLLAQTWPKKSSIRRTPGQPTLVMLAHPRCPCTSASIDELAELLAHTHGKVNSYVLFLKPEERDWAETSLQRAAAAIPGVTVLSDPDGAEAKLFGAQTSGHTLLFDANGHLVFSGGITGSRGHAGANAGENALVALLNDQPAERSATLVFGCSLSGGEQKSGGQLTCRK